MNEEPHLSLDVPGSTHTSESQYTQAAQWGHMQALQETEDFEPLDEVGTFDIGKKTNPIRYQDAVEGLNRMAEGFDYEDKSPVQGTKLDTGKPNFALFPGHVLADIAAVLSDGADRPEYGPDNWRQGLTLRRLLSAAMRHIMAFNDGQDYDPKSPFAPRCHLANAMCMLIFAMEMWKTRPDMDDRFHGIDLDLITQAFEGGYRG